MNSIAFAVIVLVVLGLAGGIILVLASKFMAVYEDPRIAQITECLAGANCGGCGYAGCADYAKAIVENGAPTNKCAPGGAKATEAVNAIMGTESASGPALHAVVNCNGGNGNCGARFEYHGIPTCAAAAATQRACGSAFPISSEASIMILLAINLISSPAYSIRAK